MSNSEDYQLQQQMFNFSAEMRDKARSFDPLREAVFDWVHKNITSLSTAERGVPHLTFRDHNLGIAQYDESGERFFAVRFTRGRDEASWHTANNTALNITTEIVARAGEKDMTLHVSESYQKRKFARLLPFDKIAQPPAILPALAPFISSEDAGWPLAYGLMEMDEGSNFKQLGLSIVNQNRMLPLIVAVGPADSGKSDWDKDSLAILAEQSFGYAHVVYMPAALMEKFNKNIGTRWHPYPGSVRQYNKGFKPGDILTEHPFLSTLNRRPDQRQQQLTQLTQELISQSKMPSSVSALNFDSVYRFSVDRTLAHSNDHLDPVEHIVLLQEKLAMSERDTKEFAGMAEEALAEVERLEAVIATMGEKPEIIAPEKKKNLFDKHTQWKCASFEFGIPVPERIAHVEAWAKTYFSEALVLCKPFVDECKNLKDYDEGRTRNFYKMLTIMGIYYGADYCLDLKMRKEHLLANGSLDQALQEHGLDMTQSSEATLSRYRKDYQAKCPDGIIWNLDWHAKDGSVNSDSRHMLRLYFAINTAENGPKRNAKSFVVMGRGPGHLPIISR